jgi:hypothetical protein
LAEEKENSSCGDYLRGKFYADMQVRMEKEEQGLLPVFGIIKYFNISESLRRLWAKKKGGLGLFSTFEIRKNRLIQVGKFGHICTGPRVFTFKMGSGGGCLLPVHHQGKSLLSDR